jgi:hypothetical protein
VKRAAASAIRTGVRCLVLTLYLERVLVQPGSALVDFRLPACVLCVLA